MVREFVQSYPLEGKLDSVGACLHHLPGQLSSFPVLSQGLEPRRQSRNDRVVLLENLKRAKVPL